MTMTARNPALHQQVQNWAGRGWLDKVGASFAFGPYDLARRFRDDLKAAGAVNPTRQLSGGKGLWITSYQWAIGHLTMTCIGSTVVNRRETTVSATRTIIPSVGLIRGAHA